MRRLRKSSDGRLMFWCPGCDAVHAVQVGEGPGPRWGWNANMEWPTFTPSIRVTYNGDDADEAGAIPSCCHSFVTDGRIEFCGDSTHALSGQTVDLPDVRRGWPK